MTQSTYHVDDLTEEALELMEWSCLRREACGLTDAEFVEMNALANRLKFADDFNQPSFVQEEARLRFASLKARAYARAEAVRKAGEICQTLLERSCGNWRDDAVLHASEWICPTAASESSVL